MYVPRSTISKNKLLKHRRPKLTIRGVILCFFLLLCELSAKRDMRHILLPNNRNVTLALRHMEVLCYKHLRFEFIKLCMGTQRFCWKSQFCLYFVNKINLPCCFVVFFCLPAPQADLTRFRRVIVRWVSTAKAVSNAYPRAKNTQWCIHHFPSLALSS